MRTAIAVIAGLLGGFVAGIMLNEILAIIGLMVFDSPEELRVLRGTPALTSLLGAAAAVAIERRTAR